MMDEVTFGQEWYWIIVELLNAIMFTMIEMRASIMQNRLIITLDKPNQVEKRNQKLLKL